MKRQSSSRVPQSWDEYERGLSPRQGSITSETSRVHFDEESPFPVTDRLENPRHGSSEETLRRRRYIWRFLKSQFSCGLLTRCYNTRSSLSMRVSSFAQLGGVNSLENFARSWQRAAGFNEIPSGRLSFEGQEDDNLIQHTSADNRSVPQHKSLLGQQLEREGTSSDVVIDDSAVPQSYDDAEVVRSRTLSDHARDSPLSSSPYLGSPFPSSYGGLYGSLTTRVPSPATPPARQISKAQRESNGQQLDREQEPLLLKVVETEDGKLVRVIIGQSTLPQTVFNSVNTLIGIGILSLPLGLRYSGWLIGVLFFFFAALTTRYTAGLLAKCLTADDSLVTFADLAYVSFGSKARIATSVLFSIELLAACVALVVLFGDSVNALVPIWGNVEWKIFCGALLIPLSFVPLRYLSVTSVLGIICGLGSMYIEEDTTGNTQLIKLQL